MKISIFRIQLLSDTVTFRSYVKELGGLESTAPQTNSVEGAGRVEKTVGGGVNPPGPPPPNKIGRKGGGGEKKGGGGVHPPPPPTTKSLAMCC